LREVRLLYFLPLIIRLAYHDKLSLFPFLTAGIDTKAGDMT